MLYPVVRRAFHRLPPLLQQSLRSRRSQWQIRGRRRALATVGAGDLEVADVNHLLHHLRGRALSELPRSAEHFVSVGCSGTWYFNWIEQMCGPIRRHTGIEFYSLRPTDLPANVVWIANTAGAMPELGDSVADLLFSGQNIEHLWSEDVAGFLLESHRVLADNGLLVVDSPNRRITAKLGWSQPEHTIEFEASEMIELLELAGFDVQRKFGIWLCEDPASGATLPFETLSANGPWPLSLRVAAAAANIDSSFIWWIEARKRDRPPEIERLRRRVGEIFALAWPERVNRLKTAIGSEITVDGTAWFDSHGRGGALMFGPYLPLRKGHYSVTFELSLVGPTSPADRCAAICEVISGDGSQVAARREIRVAALSAQPVLPVTLDFSLGATTFAIQFRVIALAGIRIRAAKSLKLADVSVPAQAAAAAT
jgi:Methyltransferase domain